MISFGWKDMLALPHTVMLHLRAPRGPDTARPGRTAWRQDPNNLLGIGGFHAKTPGRHAATARDVAWVRDLRYDPAATDEQRCDRGGCAMGTTRRTPGWVQRLAAIFPAVLVAVFLAGPWPVGQAYAAATPGDIFTVADIPVDPTANSALAAREAARIDGQRRAFGVLIERDRKSTRLNSSHTVSSYAVFCL